MSLKVLAVDDSATDRMIIKSMLGDYVILTAGDGAEALLMLEEHEGIDIMILDLNMPVMNGFQVLEAVKSDDRYKNLRTIILTNQDELDNEIRGLQQGAVDFIRKPIHMESLKSRIDVHAALIHAQKALEKRYQKLTATFDLVLKQVPVGIAISYGKDANFLDNNKFFIVNHAFEKITGRTEEELLSLGWKAITHPDDLERELQYFDKLKSGEIDSYSIDKRYIRPDGSVVWVNILRAPFELSEDHAFNHITVVKDISERKAMEMKLVENERSKAVLLSNLHGMAYRYSLDSIWTMQYVSAGCFALTGYHPESLIGNKDIAYVDIIAPEYRESLWEKWTGVIAEKKQFKHEYEIITADGTRKWVLELGQGVYDEEGRAEALEGFIIDISDRKDVEDKLVYSNEHDDWTGLYNRHHLIETLNRDWKARSPEKRALISIDLNSLYTLGVTYGFLYSQNLIKEFSGTIAEFCRDKCMLFSSSEYCFVLYIKGYANKDELVDFCKAVSGVLAPLLTVERINVGIGVLEINEENRSDVVTALKNLFMAAEEAAHSGDDENNIRFYDKKPEERVYRSEVLQHEMALVAAGENRERLFLQYQPILDLRHNAVCGFEALARYNSEKLGLVSPQEFIPIIERTKHIIPIGSLIIQKACEFVLKLARSGFDKTDISVNISAVQLLSKGFVEDTLDIIKRMKVDPNRIHIELTESVFVSNVDGINRILNRLGEYGIKSSIDDFGTGYSSLSRERDLDVDFLKIDKSFISKLMHLKEEEAITGDIISTAHKLDLCVVAEGVEHEKQLNYLKTYGCDRVQGFLISEPLDEDEAIEFLKTGRALGYACGRKDPASCGSEP